MNCPFCEEKSKELVLFETEHSRVMINLFPAALGHLLVLPREHTCSLSELPPDVSGDMFSSAVQAANVLKAALSPQGVNIFLNEGKVAGQTCEHLHLHVIPRNEGDNLENFKRRAGGKREEVSEICKEQLKKAFL